MTAKRKEQKDNPLPFCYSVAVRKKNAASDCPETALVCVCHRKSCKRKRKRDRRGEINFMNAADNVYIEQHADESTRTLEQRSSPDAPTQD